MNLTPGYGRAAGLSPNDPRFQGRRYRQLVAAFNVYRASPIAAESVPPPKIHTSYRGVPLTCSASVVSVGNSDVTFAMEKLHAMAIARSGRSVIMSPLHGMSFTVTPVGVDPDAGHASFAQFLSQRRGGAEQRINPRVEPEFNINVGLECFDRERCGRLHDLSVVSVAVSFKESEFEGMRNGDMVKLHIPRLAPGSGISIDARGKIIRNMPAIGCEGKTRDVVISLQVYPELKRLLERYVDVRRITTIRDLASSKISEDEEYHAQPAIPRRRPQAL
ncbi:MAG: PilZ domain-containing protein [Gammaproteobacteria bacterium]|nr:PilZ domain-containing protein [Gammaproteobacteria bacterium]